MGDPEPPDSPRRCPGLPLGRSQTRVHQDGEPAPVTRQESRPLAAFLCAQEILANPPAEGLADEAGIDSLHIIEPEAVADDADQRRGFVGPWDAGEPPTEKGAQARRNPSFKVTHIEAILA